MDAARTLLTRYLRAAWRRRWMGLIVAWLVCGVGWAGVTMIPNQYESSARLFVDADAVLTPLLRGLAADTAPTSQLEMLQRTLLSHPNLEKLVSKTDLDLALNSASDRERLISRLAADIRVNPQTRNLFTITFRDKSPKLARDVVQTLLTIFIESATGGSRTDMENARHFLERQIQSYELQLRAAEKRRADFRSRYPEIMPTDANPGVPALEGARMQVQAIGGRLQDAVQARDALRQEVQSTPPMLVVESGTLLNGQPVARTRLQDAQDQLDLLLLRDTDQHPDVVAQRKLIDALKKEPAAPVRSSATPSRTTPSGATPSGTTPSGATPSGTTPSGTTPSGTTPSRAASRPDPSRREAAQEAAARGDPARSARDSSGAGGLRRSVPNAVYDQLKVKLVDADSLVSSLQRQRDDAVQYRDRLEKVQQEQPGLIAEYQNMDRDYAVLRRNYEELLTRLQSANIAQAADTQADKVKLQIIDPPEIPRLPAAPNRLLLTTGVLLGGLLTGAGMTVLFGQLDRSFSSVDELRALGLPVLGGISVLGLIPLRSRVMTVCRFGAAVVVLVCLYGGLMVHILHASALI